MVLILLWTNLINKKNINLVARKEWNFSMTELFIQTNKEQKQIALVENGKLIEYYEEND